MLTRTWKTVFDAMLPAKTGSTQERWDRVGKDPAYDLIWERPLLETQPEEILSVIRTGTIATHVFLRRMQNYCIDMGWLPVPIIAKRKWPKLKHGETRAITAEEHQLILGGEKNPERHDYYELLWYLGGSQGDIAALQAEDVNWEKGTVFYRRQKTSVEVMQRMGGRVKEVLNRLPKAGPLFPHLIKMRASDRATEFKRVCRRVGVNGVTPHSYRYAWAERAAENGYEERYAQAALGHNSKAVARAYLPIDKTGADLLFQVISQPYEQGSILLTTNQPYKHWAKIFNNDSTLTSAVLDRLLHHAETVILEGKSYRMKDQIETP